ncbi:MAG: terminase small subunit [Gemmatimonadaceae bacterium]
MTRKEISEGVGGRQTRITGKKTGKQAVMRSPRSGAEVPTGAHSSNTGGKPGRSGRPPSAIRELLRGSFADRVQTLTDIADGEAVVKMRDKYGHETETMVSADVSDRIKAIDMLAKYGLGAVHGVSLDDVRERLEGTLEEVKARTSPEQFAAIVEAVEAVWRR